MYQEVDQQLDECERVVGHWEPSKKFLSLYRKLDELSDVIEELDPKTMDLIGNSAKQLNKELDEILRRMLLTETKQVVRAYMISGFDFASRDIGGFSDPYLRLTIGKKTYNEKKNY